MVEDIPQGRYGCADRDCKQRFDTVGDKKRHMRSEHAEEDDL